MRLLDTPQWAALTTAEKMMINNIDGAGDEYTANFSPGAEKLVDSLAARGLVTVTWGDTHHRARQGTVRLRDEGWR